MHSETNSFHEVHADTLPNDATRICPLIGNSEIKLILDARGAMHDFTPSSERQQTACWPRPRIVRAGRRYNRRPDRFNSNLIEWGFLDVSLVGEDSLGEACSWTQRLVPREGRVETEIGYGAAGLRAVSFVHLDSNLVVFHRAYERLPAGRDWAIEATYTLCEQTVEELPFHVTWRPLTADTNGIAAETQADGLRMYRGRIALFSNRASEAAAEGNRLRLRVPLDGHGRATVFLVMLDDVGNELPHMPSQTNDWMPEEVRAVNDELLATPVEKPDPVRAISDLRKWVDEVGYGGVLQSQKQAWAAFYQPVSIRLPAEQTRLSAALDTALYTLRSSWTRYSIPAGAFNSAWGAGYFADEYWPMEALLALGLFELPKQTIEWKRRCLPFAAEMTAGSGARYMHCVNEGGALMTERNHMNFNQWWQLGMIAHYVTEYCRRVDTEEAWRRYYPIVREIAEFYRHYLVIKLPGRGAMIPFTEFEGSGPKQDLNQVMVGAAFTLDSVAQWAERLGADAERIAEWRGLSEDVLASYQEMLGDTLPRGTGAFYIDFDLHRKADLRSLLDPDVVAWRTTERNRIKRRSSTTTNICGEKAIKKFWPWGTLDRAFAEATLGHAEHAAELLAESTQAPIDFVAPYESGVLDSNQSNGFALLQHPWFTTSAGAYVRALARMLVYGYEDAVYLLPGVPASWADLEFDLPVHGAGRVHVRLRSGRLEALRLHEVVRRVQARELHLPKRFADAARIRDEAVEERRETADELIVRVRCQEDCVVVCDV